MLNNCLISTLPIKVINVNHEAHQFNCDALFKIVDESSLIDKVPSLPFIDEFLSLNFKKVKDNNIFFFKKEQEKPIFIVKVKEKNIKDLRLIGAKIASVIKAEKFSSVKVKNFTDVGDLKIARGIVDRCYNFSKYITEKKEELVSLKEIYLHNVNKEIKNECIERLNDEIRSIFLIRDLVNEPANIIFPGSVESLVKDLFKKSKNVNLKIYNLEDLKKMGANLLLAVGLGHDSAEKAPRMIVIEYKGNTRSDEFDLAVVGKGVTFDSGGYSVKPANSMEGMKGDMAGAANVIGVMEYVVNRQLPVNIIGTIALTENMINGNATKPGDIVKSLSGLTVEILNTDAEGRLILADALYHTSSIYRPKYLLDFATLTGAIFVALGSEIAGLFSNSDEFVDKISECSKDTNEKVWRMPIGEEFTELMKSKIADLRNISTSSGEGSSCTAAAFLEKFIAEHKNWIHLDIAGVSDYDKEHKLYGYGASAWGFRLLKNFIEKKLLNNN